MAVAIDHPKWAIYTLSAFLNTAEPDDTNVLIIHNKQISLGCPAADAVLIRYNGWQ